MKRHTAVIATLILILGALSVSGHAVATGDDQEYEQRQDAEREPNCRGTDSDDDGNADRQATGVVVDPNRVDDLAEDVTGDDPGLFGSGDKFPIEIDLTVGGEHAATFCQGEQWDGQDPNTRESDRNSETGGNADDPLADAGSGDVYVNPLYDGDCSGYDDSDGGDGCPGGTDKPKLTEGANVRTTADAPGADDDAQRASSYTNAEVWGVIRLSLAVGADHDDREGWAFLYGEDHSDQLSTAIFGNDYPVTDDGNLICIPFDFGQGGSCGEGDCDSHEYQYASSGTKHDGHPHSCERDNTVLAGLQVGYTWLLPASSSQDSPTAAPPVLP